jgi:hypothetical protein
MIIEMTNQETKKKVEIEVDDINVDELKEQFKPVLTEERLRKIIDNLDVSADVKAILSELLTFSIKIGEVVLEVGRKIIEVIKILVKAYPNTAAGLVVGALIGLLLSSIPVLGWLLGWLLVPLFTALGLALGMWKDLGNSELGTAIEDVMKTVFSGLKNIPVRA